MDALVHITSWNENALRVARQQAEPGAPDPGPTKGPAGVLHINVDRFNAETLAARRTWTPARAIRWANDVHRGLLAALRALPEERLLGGRGRHGARMWYWMPGFIHSVGTRRALEHRLSSTAARHQGEPVRIADGWDEASPALLPVRARRLSP